MKRIVIIPTYNECENVARMTDKVMSLDGAFDLLYVDDGSPDGTADIIRAKIAEYGDRVHLVERSGNEVLYLYKFEPFQHVINLTSHVGNSSPMYCTGVGKSILAQLSEQELQEYWAATEIQSYTPTTITDLETMKQELEQIRQRGYAIDDEEHDAGVRCLAAPIFDWEGNAIGAISISTPPSRLNESTIQRLYPRLMETAAEISHLLGYVPK